MLETVREYALERLEESGEAAALQRRHAACFLALAEKDAPYTIYDEREAAWCARLAADIDNLRAMALYQESLVSHLERKGQGGYYIALYEIG